MRKELEILSQIDAFLDGEITKEKLEQSLDYVVDLEEQIETQKILRTSIHKEAFITQSQKSLSKFKLIKVMVIASISIAIVAAIIGVTLLLNNPTKTTVKSPSILQAKQELKEKEFIEKQHNNGVNEEKRATKKEFDKSTSDAAVAKKISSSFWRGKLIQNMKSFEFVFKLINIDSNQYYGISKIIDGDDYAIIKAKCRYENGKLSFKEYEILEESSINNEWCIKSGELRFKSKIGLYLLGDWWGKCAFGTLELRLVKDDKSLDIYNP